MSTGNANLDLLIKLLSTATHPTTPDNIALVAMRKAGDQLTKFKTDWAGLLKGRVTVVQDPFARTDAPQVKPRPAPSATPPAPPPPPPPTQPRPSTNARDLNMAEAAGAISARNSGGRWTNPHPTGSALEAAWFKGFDQERFRRAKAQRAQPRPTKPTPRPDPAATTTQAAQPRRTNQYPGKCYTCSRDVPAGSGFLAGKGANGQYRVVCGDNFGHNAPYAQRSTRPQASADDIANLLDDIPF